MAKYHSTYAAARRDLKAARIACNKIVVKASWIIEAYDGEEDIAACAKLICETTAELDELIKQLDLAITRR